MTCDAVCSLGRNKKILKFTFPASRWKHLFLRCGPIQVWFWKCPSWVPHLIRQRCCSQKFLCDVFCPGGACSSHVAPRCCCTLPLVSTSSGWMDRCRIVFRLVQVRQTAAKYTSTLVHPDKNILKPGNGDVSSPKNVLEMHSRTCCQAELLFLGLRVKELINSHNC